MATQKSALFNLAFACVGEKCKSCLHIENTKLLDISEVYNFRNKVVKVRKQARIPTFLMIRYLKALIASNTN